MANKQKNNEENVAELLSSLKENQDKILKQMSASTDKYNKTYSREQKSLLDLAIRNLNKIRNEEIKNIEMRIQQLEILKKQTEEQHDKQFKEKEIEHKKEQIKFKEMKELRDREFNEFQKLISEEHKILLTNDNERYEKYLEEVENKKENLEEANKKLEEQNKKIKTSGLEIDKLIVKLAENHGESVDNANNEILNLKKRKEEIQRIRKEQTEEYLEKSRQQSIINNLYYESIRKQKESLGFGNRVIDEFTGVFSMFGEGTKILGTSSKFLLDVMTKPSKKKIEEQVQKDSIGTFSTTTIPPTQDIPQPEPDIEKKPNVEKPTPDIEKKPNVEKPTPDIEKKPNVEKILSQSKVEKQTFEEKTTNNNNTEKSTIALKREERFQKTHEALMKIKDNPKVRKKEEYNAKRRKTTKLDIQNKSDDTIGDIAPIEKAEDKKEEKNRFEKLNKSMDSVKDAVEKTQGFALIQMIQMVGIIGGLAITMGLWYDLWKQKKELDGVLESNKKERDFRHSHANEKEEPFIKEVKARIERTTDIGDKKKLEDALSEYKQNNLISRVAEKGGPIAAKDLTPEEIEGTKGIPFAKFNKEKAIQNEGTSWSKLLTLNTSLREKEEKQKTEIEKKQKEEIKNQRIDSESFYKVTEEDRCITQLQQATTELENAKMKNQKDTGTPSITVNVPTNDESTSILGDILEVLSNRQPTTELK
jgi:tetratricopeptide (TPR) repeat protein